MPALVESAYWNGAHACSTAGPTIRAKHVATMRRKLVPVAMPRTPPFGFRNAVIFAAMNASAMSAGTSARAKRRAALWSSAAVSSSSKATLRCS